MRLIFSDEAGMLKPSEYYLRCAVMIPEDCYFTLQQEFFKLKEKYNIPLDEEFKASDVWYIKRYQKSGINLPRKHRARLQKYVHNDYTYYLEFVKNSLKVLSEDTIIIVIWTYFFKSVFKDQSEIERDFLQTLMLRVEDELRERGRTEL